MLNQTASHTELHAAQLMIWSWNRVQPPILNTLMAVPKILNHFGQLLNPSSTHIPQQNNFHQRFPNHWPTLASFFREKIISLKLSISFKLGVPSSPFVFDKPHTGQTLTTSHLSLQLKEHNCSTLCLTNRHHLLQRLDWNRAPVFSRFSCLTLWACPLIRPPSRQNSNMLWFFSLHPFLKNPVCQGQTSQTSVHF